MKKLNLRVLLTARCNHRCTFCSRDFYQGTKSDLDENLLYSAIRTFATLGGEKVTYSGGEPLLSPLLLPAMRLVHKLGMKNAVTTNGSLLGEQSEEFWTLANSANISLPSFRSDEYAHAVGVKNVSLEKVKKNALLAVHKGLQVKINSVYIPKNTGDLGSMVDYFAPYGIVVKLMNDMWGDSAYYAGFLRYVRLWENDPRVEIEKALHPGYVMCSDCHVARHSSCPSCKSIWLYPDGSVTVCPLDKTRHIHCSTAAQVESAVRKLWLAVEND